MITEGCAENYYGDQMLYWSNEDTPPTEWEGKPVPINAKGMNLDTGVVFYYHPSGVWKAIGGGGN